MAHVHGFLHESHVELRIGYPFLYNAFEFLQKSLVDFAEFISVAAGCSISFSGAAVSVAGLDSGLASILEDMSEARRRRAPRMFLILLDSNLALKGFVM